jgi:hypothetical protein
MDSLAPTPPGTPPWPRRGYRTSRRWVFLKYPERLIEKVECLLGVYGLLAEGFDPLTI